MSSTFPSTSPRELDAWEDIFRLPELLDDRRGGRVRPLQANIYETEDSVVAEVAVPGIKPEDLTISLTGNILKVSGETKHEDKDEQRDYYQRSIMFGKFSQTFSLPSGVKSDNVEAQFKNGMLKLVLPKAEVSTAKMIPIKKS